jgi:hypothetical protein
VTQAHRTPTEQRTAEHQWVLVNWRLPRGIQSTADRYRERNRPVERYDGTVGDLPLERSNSRGGENVVLPYGGSLGAGPSVGRMEGSSSGATAGGPLTGPETRTMVGPREDGGRDRGPDIRVPTGLSTNQAVRPRMPWHPGQHVWHVWVPEGYGGYSPILMTRFGSDAPRSGEDMYRIYRTGNYGTCVEGMPTVRKDRPFTQEEHDSSEYNQYSLLESCLLVREQGFTPWGIRKTIEEEVSPARVACRLDWEMLSPTKKRDKRAFMASSCAILLNVEVYARLVTGITLPPRTCRPMRKGEKLVPRQVVEVFIRSGVTVEEVRGWANMLGDWATAYVAAHGGYMDPADDVAIAMRERGRPPERYTVEECFGRGQRAIALNPSIGDGCELGGMAPVWTGEDPAIMVVGASLSGNPTTIPFDRLTISEPVTATSGAVPQSDPGAVMEAAPPSTIPASSASGNGADSNPVESVVMGDPEPEWEDDDSE